MYIATTQTYLSIKKSKLCKNTKQNTIRILDLNGVPVLQVNSPVTYPTNINPTLLSTVPFYEAYTIDPSGALFGQTSYPCNINTWKKYVVLFNC